MTISVYRWGDNRPATYDLAEYDEILLFDPLDERGSDSLFNRFRSLDRGVQSSETIVLRTSSTRAQEHWKKDSTLRSITKDQSVFALTRSSNPDDTAPQSLHLWGPEVELPIDDIRQAEVESILRRSGAVVDSNGRHFILPSGLHSERFIRVANGVQTIEDCRRLADWLLAHVTADSDLLADTSTILPLLQEVQRHCQRAYQWSTRIDAIDEYPSVTAMEQRIRDLRRRQRTGPESDRSITYIVSVNSSGSTFALFDSFADRTIGDRSVVVCDAHPNDASRPSLAVVQTETLSPGESGQCESCGSGKLTITIHQRTYEQVVDFKTTLLAVGPTQAEKNRDLFEMLSAPGAVRLHYNDDSNRHHALWLDSNQLLDTEAFSAELSSRMQALIPKPDLVLIPSGHVASRLQEIAKECLGVALVVPSGDLSPEVESLVDVSNSVLLLDASASSGATLVALRRRVYNRARRIDRSPPVHGLVLLARSDSEAAWKDIQRPFFRGSASLLTALREVWLPSRRECPFCIEVSLLRQWYPKLSPTSQILANARIEILQAEVHEPVQLGSSGNEQGLKTVDSFFGDLPELPAFAAATSAAISVIEKGNHGIAPNSIGVLNIEAAMSAYFDSILLTGVLRSCRKEHVRSSQSDRKISAKVRDLCDLGTALSSQARCEIGWAAVREVIPAAGVELLLRDIKAPEAGLLIELLALKSQKLP